ncbi:MAG: CPBP family intramembrane metalloprotease [Planctomycetes bacterium]|nr:CPBP family intramembrane metalloprotease [Planctomycetota bacterium]
MAGIVLMLYAGGESVAAGQVEQDWLAATQAVPQRPEISSAGLTILIVTGVLAAPLALGLFIWRRWYRLAGSPRRPEAFSALAGAAMFFGMLLLDQLGGLVVQGLLGGDQITVGPLEDQARLLIGRYAGQAIIVAVFVWLGWRATARSARGGPGPLRASLIGAGALLVFWPMVMCASYAAGYLVEHLGDEPVDPIAHETLNLLLSSPVDGWFFVMVALVVIAAPLLEEVMYRGILQRVMVQVGMGRWPAIIATSVIFALMHLDVAQWHAVAAIFVLSVGFGWVYEKTGRLAAAVTMHALFNAANLALAPLLVPGLC